MDMGGNRECEIPQDRTRNLGLNISFIVFSSMLFHLHVVGWFFSLLHFQAQTTAMCFASIGPLEDLCAYLLLSHFLHWNWLAVPFRRNTAALQSVIPVED